VTRSGSSFRGVDLIRGLARRGDSISLRLARGIIPCARQAVKRVRGVIGYPPSAPGVAEPPASDPEDWPGSQVPADGAQVWVAVRSRIEGEALWGSGVPMAIPVLKGANAWGVQGR